jgi:hypothetical protein
VKQQVREHALVHEEAHLLGNAGKEIEAHLVFHKGEAANIRLRVQQLGIFGHPGQLLERCGHLHSPGLDIAPDLFQHVAVKAERPVERLGHDPVGQIVIRGSQAPGDDDKVGTRYGFFQGRGNTLRFIAHRSHARNPEAGSGQPAGSIP